MRSARSASMRSSSICRLISLTRSSASFSRAQRAASSSRRAFASASSRSTGSRRPSTPCPSRPLDLELAHAALRLVELERRRVDLHPQARGGLVDEVDRLVGQEAVGCSGRRGPPRRRAPRRDPHAVVRLVTLLEPAQDRDRVRDGRLADEDRLEAPLERRRPSRCACGTRRGRRADRAQLAAREHRLEQVGRVDGALGRARADDRVQLVDEETISPSAFLISARTALIRSSNSPRYFEPARSAPMSSAQTRLPLSLRARRRRRSAARGPRRSRSSRPRVADQHRVVLRAAREHLDHAPDLLVAADDRVELALLGELRQVAAELLERLVRALGVLGRDAGRRAPPPAREQLVAGDGVEREQEVLDRDELVLELAHLLLGAVEHLGERGRGARLLGRALERRLARVSPRLPRATRPDPARAREAAPGRAARAGGARGRSPGCRGGARPPARRRSPPAT